MSSSVAQAMAIYKTISDKQKQPPEHQTIEKQPETPSTLKPLAETYEKLSS